MHVAEAEVRYGWRGQCTARRRRVTHACQVKLRGSRRQGERERREIKGFPFLCKEGDKGWELRNIIPYSNLCIFI
jgi:hypothetical protein